jgi:uncharacterized membrane protein YtjA (UPF0391 family)
MHAGLRSCRGSRIAIPAFDTQPRIVPTASDGTAATSRPAGRAQRVRPALRRAESPAARLRIAEQRIAEVRAAARKRLKNRRLSAIQPSRRDGTALDVVMARPQPRPSSSRRHPMLYYTLVFLIVALIAGVLGFGGIAGAAAGIAKILFFVFLVLFVLSLIFGRRKVGV